MFICHAPSQLRILYLYTGYKTRRKRSSPHQIPKKYCKGCSTAGDTSVEQSKAGTKYLSLCHFVRRLTQKKIPPPGKLSTGLHDRSAADLSSPSSPPLAFGASNRNRRAAGLLEMRRFAVWYEGLLRITVVGIGEINALARRRR